MSFFWLPNSISDKALIDSQLLLFNPAFELNYYFQKKVRNEIRVQSYAQHLNQDLLYVR